VDFFFLFVTRMRVRPWRLFIFLGGRLSLSVLVSV